MVTRSFLIPAVSIADGSGTFYSPYLSGKLESIQYIKTDYTNGVDFTITSEATGDTIWTESDVNAAAIKRPRTACHSTVGVAATLDGTRPMLDKIALSRDRVKIVIGSAGDSKIGAFRVIVSD